MATGIVGMLGGRDAATTPYIPPATGVFTPTSISFDKTDYAPGEIITATVLGTPAQNGALPTVTTVDSEGRVWTVTGQLSNQITLQAAA